MYEVRQLMVHDQIDVRVVVKDHYQIIEVFLILKTNFGDKAKEHKFRLHEPYERLTNNVLDCMRYGEVVGRRETF